jgi:hypothetical protein
VKFTASVALALSIGLLISAVVMAERWLEGQWEFPAALFFGTPIAAIALAAVVFLLFRRELATAAKPDTLRIVGLALVVPVALGSMFLLRDRYHGDYSALRGRVAPDGSRVTSVSWDERDGRYIETVNGRFQLELTQAQYREIMRRHQAPFLSGIISIATIPASLALVCFVLSWRRRVDAG